MWPLCCLWLWLAAVMAQTCEKAGVIWLHGLGDSGAGWSEIAGDFRHLSHIQWKFPDAPTNYVTCNYGPSPSWFDIHAIPVTKATAPREPLTGLKDSVDRVRRLIEEFQAQGIPSNRIVLGGFSQGSLLAVYSGLSLDYPLAGVVGFSGWLPSEDYLKDLPSKKLEVFLAHGSADQVVEFPLASVFAERLTALGHNVQLEVYPGMAHSACGKQMKDLEAFLKKVLP